MACNEVHMFWQLINVIKLNYLLFNKQKHMAVHENGHFSRFGCNKISFTFAPRRIKIFIKFELFAYLSAFVDTQVSKSVQKPMLYIAFIEAERNLPRFLQFLFKSRFKRTRICLFFFILTHVIASGISILYEKKVIHVIRNPCCVLRIHVRFRN